MAGQAREVEKVYFEVEYFNIFNDLLNASRAREVHSYHAEKRFGQMLSVSHELVPDTSLCMSYTSLYEEDVSVVGLKLGWH